MVQPVAPQGVGQTAIAVARFRAAETRRPDRLFADPLAEQFVAAAPPIRRGAGGRGAGWRGLLRYLRPGNLAHYRAMPHFIAVRTRFFDDFVRTAAQTCDQVVILAAGLDTRAFRLDLPDRTRVFEIDLPEVLAFKQGVVAREGTKPAAGRTQVPIDLREDWPSALVEAGFQPGRPTAWTAEGLLVYLTEADCEQLIGRISGLSAPGSRLALGHQDRSTVARQKANPLAGAAQTLYKSGLSERPDVWLGRHGWQATARRAADYGADYGRPLNADVGQGWLVTAERP
ncbi:SAM-dependent methyltransferase [Actinoplanes couchii]|uniref:S-adenosyl-L-methionine-dependent methyltransferase n=1 Tax=Actinoplanes couchii TaxID=403638 RepID=A0ABQ3WZG2_9ACTN|nr:SAM-dependent methyltransferase [Actinoplanes couchii]MDR6315989.1 methyltransferase (TIGR00027 family) [Actinoplanes couchii]GID51602.1 S-adenosyl-L-methionine-dependent methyltransferase [Actinoplanes couchii]